MVPTWQLYSASIYTCYDTNLPFDKRISQKSLQRMTEDCCTTS